MLAFVARRLLLSIAVLLIAAFAAFALARYAGDPVENLLGLEATVVDRERLVQALDLDAPLAIQYARFLGRALAGDLGMSLRHGRPVGDLIAERLPATLLLAAVSSVLALVGGIALGVIASAFRRSLFARALFWGALIVAAVPAFLTAILLVWIFAAQLAWLPAFGSAAAAGLAALVLPALTLALYQLSLVARLVRAEMLAALDADFISAARARGLPELRILVHHALPNALGAAATIAGLQLGSVIAFAFVTERVFQWPGVGLLLIEAIEFADTPVIAASLLLIALVFLTINLLVDLLLAALDPRARPASGALA